MPEGSARLGHEFRAAVLDEIAGLGDDVLQQFEQLADASFPVNEFRKCFEKRRVLFDGSGGAKRPAVGLCFIAAVMRLGEAPLTAKCAPLLGQGTVLLRVVEVN
jgi:hypothetical protein